MFSDAEIEYLTTQHLGRLATLQSGGALQNSPVGFSYNADTKTIDIPGIQMASTQKFRNVAANPQVAFVVDDIPSTDPLRVRCLEIRGRAEAITGDNTDDPRWDGALIRIHPERIISMGVDESGAAPAEMRPHNRNVT